MFTRGCRSFHRGGKVLTTFFVSGLLHKCFILRTKMSITERGLFDAPETELPKDERRIAARPMSDKELEERRRILAEERTMELVMRVGNMGYMALSTIYHVRGLDDTPDSPPTPLTPPGFVQDKLL